jgi:hypothetical protein
MNKSLRNSILAFEQRKKNSPDEEVLLLQTDFLNLLDDGVEIMQLNILIRGHYEHHAIYRGVGIKTYSDGYFARLQ